MPTEDRELLGQIEAYVERSYGVRLRHRHDRRRWRRFFSHLSFQFEVNRGSGRSISSAVEAWPPLDVFRSTALQREGLSAIRYSELPNEKLSNLMVPLEIASDHRGISQKMIDSVVDSFIYERHIINDIPFPQIHQEFATIILLSMISDRVIIVETDFSHERNTTLKYVVRPLEVKVFRSPNISRKINLFFSKNIDRQAESGIYLGIQRNLSSIFNHDIGRADFSTIEGERNSFGPHPEAGFLILAARRGDYSCAYIFPLYGLINRTSSLIERMHGLFSVFMNILSQKAREKIEINRGHSRVRHTIGVELRHMKSAYKEIFEDRHNTLSRYDTGRDHMNILFARVNNSIDEMSRDLENQFNAEFDLFGNKTKTISTNKNNQVLIEPDQLKTLIRQIADNVVLQIPRSPFIFNLEHDQPVRIGSESALRNCLTELLNNSAKYNVAYQPIRVRTRNRGDEVIFSVANVGPSVTQEEASAIPLMGLRGINSQRHVENGSGQGLAAVFGILKEIGVDPEYRPRALSGDQVSRLTQEFGSKRLRELDLAYHIVELTFSS